MNVLVTVYVCGARSRRLDEGLDLRAPLELDLFHAHLPHIQAAFWKRSGGRYERRHILRTAARSTAGKLQMDSCSPAQSTGVTFE